MRIFLSIIIASLTVLSISAQNFQRNYRLQVFEEVINIDGVQTMDGGYLSLNAISLDTSFQSVFISRYDIKGTLSWTKELVTIDNDSLELEISDGTIFEGAQGQIFYSYVLRRDDEPNKMVGSLTDTGEYFWSKVIREFTMDPHSDIGPNKIATYIEEDYLNATTLGTAENPKNILTTFDKSGVIQLAFDMNTTFDGVPVAQQLGDVKPAVDTSIAVVGGIRSTKSYTLNVFDKRHQTSIAKYFRDTMNEDIEYFAHSVVSTRDSGFLVAGEMIIPLTGTGDTIFSSFIAKHDTIGDIVWAKRLGLGNNETTIINGIVENPDSSIMVASIADIEADSSYTILSKLDKEGNWQWNTIYDRVDQIFNAFGSLNATNDGGYVIFNTAVVDTLPRTNLIKVDAAGSSTCENVLDQDIFVRTDIAGKDIIVALDSTETIGYEEYASRADNFNSFAIPALSITAPSICPNIQIDTFLVATVGGNEEDIISYMWDNDPSLNEDTLRVMDDEMHTVIVTMSGEVCYTLCDTAAVEVLAEPKLNPIAPAYDCPNGQYILTAQPNVAAGLDSIVWSTGEQGVLQISVDPGSYSVTITDNCGLTADASVTVEEPVPNFEIQFDCAPDGIFLEPIPSDSVAQVVWSTGETTTGKLEIQNTGQEETYSATVTNICGDTAFVTRVIQPFTPTGVGINGECTIDGIVLSADIDTFNPGILSITWNTGAQDDGKDEITVPAPINQTYAVTVTNECREDSIAIFTPDDVLTSPQLNLDSTCIQGGGFMINSGLSPGEYLNMQWSTGAQDDNLANISVTAAGNYSVTLTDLCGLESMGNIDLPMLPDMVTITPDFITACDNGPVTLTATANGDVDFLWTPGNFLGSVFGVEEPGTYTVNATDGCDNVLTESFTFTEADLPIEVTELAIDQDADGFCVTNMVTLTARVLGNTTGIEWSTGETTGEIAVNVEGQTISLTAFDECGNETTERVINVSTSSGLQFPEIFFPTKEIGGAYQFDNNENTLFGGYVDQTDTMMMEVNELYVDFTDFEMHIFNRWGQEVFNSTSIYDRWNGFIEEENDKPALPDVYIWWAKWTDAEGCTFERKGDVTLFR